MIKKSMVIIGGLLLSFALHGCSSSIKSIQYENQERPIEDVEEMLSDKLESENPQAEFTVTITEDID